MSVSSRFSLIATGALWGWHAGAADLQVIFERQGPSYFRQEVWLKDGTFSNDDADQYLKSITKRAVNTQLIQIRFYGDPRERWGRASSPHRPYSMVLQAAKAPQLSIISEVLILGKAGVQRTWAPNRGMVMRLLGNGDPLLVRTSRPARVFRLVFLQFWSDDYEGQSGSPEALELFLISDSIPTPSEGQGVFRELRSRFPSAILSISVASKAWFPFSMYFPAPFPLSPEGPPTATEYAKLPMLQCDDYQARVICVGGGGEPR